MVRAVGGRNRARLAASVCGLLLLATACSAPVQLPPGASSAQAQATGDDPAVAESTPADSESTTEAGTDEAVGNGGAVPEPTSDGSAPNPTSNDPTPAESTPLDFEVSDEWPPVLRDYVDFVQRARGEEFQSVAALRFADQETIVEEFQSDYFTLDDLDPEAQQIILRLDDMYRAFGLTNAEFNLLDANRAVVGDIAAFYDWEVAEIVFPSPDGEAVDEIPIVDRPVLVHELGHALQADSRLEWTQDLPDQSLALALLEGEAEWLFDQYLWSLSEAEWNEWNDALPERQPSDQPEILEVEFSTSYVLGGRLFHARYAQDGIAGIDDVFQGFDRVTTQMLIDPWRFTGRQVRQESFGYEIPAIPDGADAIDISWEFPTTAVTWHQILGAALPGPDALTAARTINSFTVPAGWIADDGRLCFAIWVSAAFGSEDILQRALEQWATVPGVDRWVEPLRYGFEVGGCDPGPGNVPDPRATPGDVLGEVAVVIDAETWAVEAGLDPSDGYCVGWQLLAAYETDPEINSFQWLASIDKDQLPLSC